MHSSFKAKYDNSQIQNWHTKIQIKNLFIPKQWNSWFISVYISLFYSSIFHINGLFVEKKILMWLIFSKDQFEKKLKIRIYYYFLYIYIIIIYYWSKIWTYRFKNIYIINRPNFIATSKYSGLFKCSIFVRHF